MSIVSLVALIFDVFSFLILVDVISSWVMVMRVRLPDVVLDILRWIHGVVGIVLNPIRRVIPSIGGLDISPIIALLLLDLLRRVVIGALVG